MSQRIPLLTFPCALHDDPDHYSHRTVCSWCLLQLQTDLEYRTKERDELRAQLEGYRNTIIVEGPSIPYAVRRAEAPIDIPTHSSLIDILNELGRLRKRERECKCE